MNIGESDMTSVKVHAGPGGKTSIDLFGGYGKDKDDEVKPIAAVAPVHEEIKDDDSAAGKPKDADSHTSIKVRQPPGGASSFSFG